MSCKNKYTAGVVGWVNYIQCYCNISNVKYDLWSASSVIKVYSWNQYEWSKITTLLDSTWWMVLYALLEIFLTDFAVCDYWRILKLYCDIKFSQIGGNGGKFRQIELTVY